MSWSKDNTPLWEKRSSLYAHDLKISLDDKGSSKEVKKWLSIFYKAGEDKNYCEQARKAYARCRKEVGFTKLSNKNKFAFFFSLLNTHRYKDLDIWLQDQDK